MSSMDERVVPYILGLLDSAELQDLERAMQENEALLRDVVTVEQQLDQLARCEESMDIRPVVRERLLKSIEDSAPQNVLSVRLQRLFDIGAEHAQDLLGVARDVRESRWQSAGLPGAHLFHLDGGSSLAQADCGLVHLEAGVVFPMHEHLGDEWALVLEGCIREVGGRQFDVGDIAFSAAGSEHALEVVGLRAVVLATVNFNGIRVQRPASTDGQ